MEFELACKMLELSASAAVAYHAAYESAQQGNFDRSEKLERAGDEFWLASSIARNCIRKVGTEDGFDITWMWKHVGRANSAVRSAYGLGW